LSFDSGASIFETCETMQLYIDAHVTIWLSVGEAMHLMVLGFAVYETTIASPKSWKNTLTIDT